MQTLPSAVEISQNTCADNSEYRACLGSNVSVLSCRILMERSVDCIVTLASGNDGCKQRPSAYEATSAVYVDAVSKDASFGNSQ